MMPDGSYTVDALLKFLKQAAMEGMINPAVARSRRSVVEQLRAEMSEDEQRDLRRLDVDTLASRFHKLEGSSIRVEALALYVERFKSALDDFLGWNENPGSFKTVGGDKARAISRHPDGRSAISREQAQAERTSLEIREAPPEVVPIPLRPDLTVHVAGLPIDLTPAEAKRIARVVQAFVAKDSE